MTMLVEMAWFADAVIAALFARRALRARFGVVLRDELRGAGALGAAVGAWRC